MSMEASYIADGAELMKYLRDRDREGRYIYRGQMRRRTCVITTTEGDKTIEALFPSDFRFTVQNGRFMPGPPGWVTSERALKRDRRDRFYRYLWQLHAAGDTRLTWLNKYFDDNTLAGLMLLCSEPEYLTFQTADFENQVRMSNKAEEMGLTFSGPAMRSMWALAQHYEITTSMCDWTTDVNVAAWFATNPWSEDEAKPTEGRGCIYRIDRDLLSDALDRFHIFTSRQCIEQGIVPPPRFFCEGLAHIPPDCAARPSRQAGLSVHGFDQPWFLCWLARPEITLLDIYEFDHATPMQSLITRDYLVPQEDQFLPLIAEFRLGEVS